LTSTEWDPGSRIFVTRRENSQTTRFWSIPEGEEIRSWELEGTTEWTGLHLRGDRLIELTTIDPPPSPNGYGTERVRSWPLDGGEPEVLGHWDARQVTSSDIDPDGSWLAYAEGDLVSLRRLHGLETSPPEVVGRHEDEKVGVRFHPRGDRLVTGGEAGEVRIWSLDGEGDQPLRTLRGEGSTLNLAIDSQDRWLAAGSSVAMKTRHSALLWGLEDPPDTQPVSLYYSHSRPVTWPMVFDPEGRWLLVPQWEHTIFWALSDRYPRVLRGQEPFSSIAFTPDGQFLASASVGTVQLWPLALAAGAELRILHQDPTAEFVVFQWAPKGDHLLVTSQIDGRVFLLPRGPGGPRVLQPPKTASGARVFGATFDHEGRRVAFSLGNNARGGMREIRIWNLESGDQQAFNPYVQGEECPDKAMGGGWIFSDMHFLPDGRMLTGGTSGVRVWDLEQATSTRLIECREDGSVFMAPVGDRGEFLVLLEYFPQGQASSPELPTQLLLLDPMSGSTRPLPSHGTRLWAIAVDPSGTVTVTGDEDGVVRVGPLGGGEPNLLLGHTQAVRDVAVSPDGRWIASASNDGTIRLWPMPDIDQPPFHTLPYEELLAKLRSLTNLRVVEDKGSATGYRIDVGPFPGWEEVPTW
jgi:WD40 repeat protein